jgi:hypothetical protein
MEAVMAPIKQAPRRYFIEFNAAMALYIAAVLARSTWAHAIADPTLRTLLLVSPILPVLLAAIAVLRFYRGIDEYHRLQILESLAIAAGAAGVITVSWSFLEDVGFPHLSIAYAWPIIAAVWGIAALYFGWKDKVAEGAAWRTVRSVALTLLYVAGGTAAAAGVAIALGTPFAWYWLTLIATVLFIARMGFFIFSKTGSC